MPYQSYNVSGWRSTGRTRIRNRWIGCVVEEERQYSDGTVKWAKRDFPVELTDRTVGKTDLAPRTPDKYS